MMCARCFKREAVIHSQSYEVSLCDVCTRAILLLADDEKRKEDEVWAASERIVSGRRK